MKNKDKIITPLNNFPTEVLLHKFRSLTYCRTHHRNSKWIKYEEWKPHYEIINGEKILTYYTLNKGEYYDEGEKFNVRYSKVICIRKDYDGTIYIYGSQNLYFSFNNMYWEGSIEELKEELDKRPHIGIMNKKDYRKWKIKNDKENKNKNKTIRR